MKQTKSSHFKMALLALASAALLSPVAQSATINPNYGDLILGFRGTNSSVACLEVDLGPISQFYGLTPGSTNTLSALSTADLSNTYGTNWYNRVDLYWGTVATAGRAAGYSNGVVNVPVKTLWASAPNCAPAWKRGSANAQQSASAIIEPLFNSGSPLKGATSTGNSDYSTVVSATAAGSWFAQDMKSGGTSFSFFNPTIDNYQGTNVVVSQLYELQPNAIGGQPGTFLGDLVLRDTGLSFIAAQSTAAIVKNSIVIQAGVGCTANVTVNDIDGGSTGYCLLLALDNTGPFSVGQTNVTLTVTDGSGFSTSAVATVTIAASAPTVASHGNISTNVAGCSAVVSFTNPTGTGCATPVNVVCSPASGATFNVGTATTVTCIGTDAINQTGTNSFTVTVTSTTAPTLSTVADSTNSTASCSGASVTYSAPSVATGCNTPMGSVSCSPASGSTFSLGSTLVSCTVTDSQNLVASTSFHVVVNSTTAPALTSVADSTNSTAGSSMAVTYSAPTVASNCNALNGSVSCSPASGSTFNVGSTAVSCTVTDVHGLVGTRSFNVVVKSTTAPVLTSVADSTNSTASCSGTAVTYSAPTVASHNNNLSGSVACSPASGTTFSIGSTLVTCTQADVQGLIGSNSFHVVVKSTTAPTINSHAEVTNIVASCGSAVVTGTNPTVANNCNPLSGSVVCSPAFGSTFSYGSTLVTCTQADTQGLIGSNSFHVVVVSTNAPTLSGTPANITTNTPNASTTNVVVTYSLPTASGCNTPGSVSCSPASGTLFQLGTTTVNCSVTDAASRTATSSFTVKVNSAGIDGIIAQVGGMSNDVNIVIIGKKSVTNTLGVARANGIIANLTNAKLYEGQAAVYQATNTYWTAVKVADYALGTKVGTNAAKIAATKATTAQVQANSKISAACAQLSAAITKISAYLSTKIMNTNDATALTSAVNGEKTAIGCH